MRQPIANKTHYANGITLLDKQFEGLFLHEKGPGALPAKNISQDETEPVTGIIVPHATYEVAGPCMAWAYKHLAEQQHDTRLYIIIAQAQNSSQTGVTNETFQLPCAEVRVDQEFTRELVKKGSIAVNDKVHAEESLIEIQLPFLQYINKGEIEKIKIVPLLVGPQTNLSTLSVDIKETLLEQNKKATFVFVSNFTAYGRSFRYVPFTDSIPRNIGLLDKQLFQTIQDKDKEAFEQVVHETLVPLSGYAALQLFFTLMKGTALLEQHYLSGDLNNDYTNTVSYASFIIKCCSLRQSFKNNSSHNLL